jgi:hypothetical protein
MPITYPKLTAVNKFKLVTPIEYAKPKPVTLTPSYNIPKALPIQYGDVRPVTLTPVYNIPKAAAIPKATLIPTAATIPFANLKPTATVSPLAKASVIGSISSSSISSILAKSEYTDAEARSLMRYYGMNDSQLSGISVMNAGNNPKTVFDIINRYTGKNVSVPGDQAPIIPATLKPVNVPEFGSTYEPIDPKPEAVAPVKMPSSVSVVTPTGSKVDRSAYVPPSYNMDEFVDAIASKQRPEGMSPTQAPVYQVTGDQYVGTPGWSESNESGEASTITQVDYAAVIGGVKIGKLFFNAIVALVKGNSSQSKQSQVLDDLSQQYDDGFITEAEFNAGVADVATQVSSASPSLASKVFDVFAKFGYTPDKPSSLSTATIFFQNAKTLGINKDKSTIADAQGGGDTASSESSTIEAQKIRKALVDIYGEEAVATQEKKDEEAKKDEEPVAVRVSTISDTVKGALGITPGSTVDSLVTPALNLVDGVVEYGTEEDPNEVPLSTASSVSVPVPVPTPNALPTETIINAETVYVRDDGQTATGTELKEYIKAGSDMTKWTNSETKARLDVSVSMSGVEFSPGLKESSLGLALRKEPINVSNNPYALTAEEKQQAVHGWLDKEYPNNAEEGGNNDLLTKYYWYLLPDMIQGEVDLTNLAAASRSFEKLMQGDIQTLYEYYPDIIQPETDMSIPYPFSTLSAQVQKDLIIAFNKDMITRNVPSVVVNLFNAGLTSQSGSIGGSTTLQTWAANGGISDGVKSDWLFMQTSGAKDYIMSKEGMVALGGGLILVGSIGAAIASGPFAGVAILGMLQFGGTEIWNAFGENPFKTKQNLQLKGNFAGDQQTQYDQAYNANMKILENVGYGKSLADPAVNLKNLADAKKAFEALQAQYKKSWIYLDAANVSEAEADRLLSFKTLLDGNISQYDALGNFLGKALPPVKLTVVNVPDGVKVEYMGGIVRSEGTSDIKDTKDKLTGNVKITLPDGRVIDQDQVVLSTTTGNQTVDISNLISKWEAYNKVKLLPAPTKVTIYVPPGAVSRWNNKYGEGGVDGEKYDVLVYPGVQLEVVTTKPGFKDSKASIYRSDYAWVPYTPQLVADTYNAVTSPGHVRFTGLDPNAAVFIDGVQIKTEGLIGYSAPAGVTKTITIMVKVPGWELATKSIKLVPGQKYELSLSPFKQEPEPYSGGGGGDFGGGGGGQQSASAPTTIVFGASLVGCHIWLDSEKLAPVIGNKYGSTAGYHAFKSCKNGFTEFEKNVYVMDGKNLEINAVFIVEAGAKYNDTTGVRIPSGGGAEPPVGTSQTFIVFGGTIAGSVVAIDGVEVLVVPGVKYPYPNGYHGILIKMAGKLDWVKNVYLAKGDTLTVSPIFEDIPIKDPVIPITPTTTTKRVFINTKPDGAKILLNDGFVGSWTPAFLDLEKGFYKLTTTKTGYATINTWVWVGDIIAFGNVALNLARVAGMDV